MQKPIVTIPFIVIIFLLFCFYPALAQDKITLTITPPLVKNNVSPGQVWQSSVKLVNNNPNEIEAYVHVVDFKGGSEGGTVEFIKKDGDGSGNDHLLSNWIIIDPGPIKIPPFSSKEISYIVDVPETAEPGGHYAAILTGTNPPEGKIEGSAIRISSLLGSLLLLKVNGDVVEQGRIREFSIMKRFYTAPNVKFKIRFENTGNIHIQPQGEIKIKNFFGKEKEIISINHNTEFGNVLPGGIRKWEFDWTGEKSLLEAGRYKASLILSYGETARETVDQTLYFWVIPLKPVLIISGLLLALILIIFYSIRTYIKRAINITQSQAGIVVPEKRLSKKKILIIPKENHSVDLKANLKKSKSKVKEQSKKFGWRLFTKLVKIIIIILIIISAGLIYSYYRGTPDKQTQEKESSVNKVDEREEEKRIDTTREDNLKKDKEEEDLEAIVKKDETLATSTVVEDEITKEEPQEVINKSEIISNLEIKVLNGGGRSGAAGEAAEILEQAGYRVNSIGNADSFNYSNIVITFKSDYEREAELIRSLFPGLVELEEETELIEDIRITVGSDF